MPDNEYINIISSALTWTWPGHRSWVQVSIRPASTGILPNAEFGAGSLPDIIAL